MPAEFGRLMTAMVTPMTASGEVDYAAAAGLAQALVASGSEGLVVTGSTGEGPTLTGDEKVGTWSAVREAVDGPVAVIAGVSTASTAMTIELAQEAERVGCDGVLLTVPAYNKPTQEGLVRHFTAIADATSLPGLLYNVPSRTALNMTAETAIRLSEHPNIVGIKEASGDLAQIAQIIDGAAAGFRVWSGNDGDTVPVLALGGYGVVSIVSHLVGRQLRELVAACCTGSGSVSAEIHHRLAPLVDAMFVESNPIPMKFALGEIGFPVGAPRLPLLPASEWAAGIIRAELSRHTIDLPVPVRT